MGTPSPNAVSGIRISSEVSGLRAAWTRHALKVPPPQAGTVLPTRLRRRSRLRSEFPGLGGFAGLRLPSSLCFRCPDCRPSFLRGRNDSSPPGSTEPTLGLRRCSLSVFQRGPTLPLCCRDSSSCGGAHRSSFRSSVSLPVWRRLGTPRTAMAELSLNLCDGCFYFGLLAFVADQSSPKKTFIVSCHFVKSLRRMLISNSWSLQNAPRFYHLPVRFKPQRRSSEVESSTASDHSLLPPSVQYSGSAIRNCGAIPQHQSGPGCTGRRLPPVYRRLAIAARR